MTAENPILDALSRMEERLVDRIDERFRDLTVDLDGRFDAVHQLRDRLEQEYEMLKAGVARIEADVATLKVDVATLKVDVAALKVDVSCPQGGRRRAQGDCWAAGCSGGA